MNNLEKIDRILELTEKLERERVNQEQERINKIYRAREAREFNDSHSWRRNHQ